MATRKKKRQLKKRHQRQLRKHYKHVRKQVNETNTIDLDQYYPPYQETLTVNIDPVYEAQKAMYQERLNTLYGGSVVALNNYVSPNAVLPHKCYSCGKVFFNSPHHMLGNKRHVCNMQKTLSNKSKHKKIKNTVSPHLADELDALLDQGLSPYVIKQKTGVDRHIVEYYRTHFYRAVAKQ